MNTDLLSLGASIYAKNIQRTELEKSQTAENQRIANTRVRQAWDILIGNHGPAIREACDSAQITADIEKDGQRKGLATLTRGRKTARIDIEYGTLGGPYWRPDNWQSWQRPNPDELTLYIWSVFYDETEQRTAIRSAQNKIADEHGIIIAERLEILDRV